MTEDNGITDNKSTSSGITVNVFGQTDVGMVRDHNEDNFLVADLSTAIRGVSKEVKNHIVGSKGTLFLVCDGMGGAAAGEIASEIGVNTIYDKMQECDAPGSDERLAVNLDNAICEAGSNIYKEAKNNSSRRGMGTTTTAAVLIGERILFGQVGDSRAHIVRNGKLVQTTKDQSLVQQLIDAGQLTEEEAKNFDRSNIILQALGTSKEVNVDITSTLLKQDDILVMCSDGLSGLVEPSEICDVIVSMSSPEEACQTLIKMACDNGGDDNITVIVARFDGDALKPASPDDIIVYEQFAFEKEYYAHKKSLSDTSKFQKITPPPSPLSTDEKTAPDSAKESGDDQTVKFISRLVILMVAIAAGVLVWALFFSQNNTSISNEADENVNVISNNTLDSESDTLDSSKGSDLNEAPALKPVNGETVVAVEKDTALPGIKHDSDSMISSDNNNTGDDTENTLDTDSADSDADSTLLDTAKENSNKIKDSDTLSGKWPTQKTKRKIIAEPELKLPDGSQEKQPSNDKKSSADKPEKKEIKDTSEIKPIPDVEPNPYE